MAKYPYIRVAIVYDDENQRDAKLRKALDAELVLAGALVLAVPSNPSPGMRHRFIPIMANGAPIYRLSAPSRRPGRMPKLSGKLPESSKTPTTAYLFEWLRQTVCGGGRQMRGYIGDGGAVTFTTGVPKFGGGIVERHPHKLAYGGEI